MIVLIALGTICLYSFYMLLLHKLLRRMRTFRRLERRLQYRLVWATRITWSSGILIFIYLAINGAVLIFLRADAERWAGVAAALNSVPLFLGGRRNVFIHYFGLHAHAMAHCIVGSVVIIEGLLHAGLTLGRAGLHTSLWDFLVRTQYL